MPSVLTEEEINRYRIAHPDKDIRSLCRRIHHVYHAGPSSSTAKGSLNKNGESLDKAAEEELERYKEITKVEVLKWKSTLGRVVASTHNLGRQGERYRKRAQETSDQAIALESTLEEEKRLLAAKLKQRDFMIRCDKVYSKITARPKSKEELDDHIINLRAQIASHRTSHAAYLELVQRRVDTFSSIIPALDEVKLMKLPTEATAETTDESMEVDAQSPGAGDDETVETEHRLSATALPFQPSPPTKNNGGSRSTPTAPSARSSSHALPHRPNGRTSPSIPTAPSAPRAPSGPAGRAASASLPQRPSGLRSSVTPGRNLLEEGEVEGEDGEVDDRKGTRSSARRR